MKRYKLGRKKSHREALLRNLASDLVEHGRVKTTLAKAKALRPAVERMVTKARRAQSGDVRELSRLFSSPAILKKMLSEIGPSFKSRPGGYTRILKLGRRGGDSAETAIIEWVEQGVKSKDSKSKSTS